MPGSVIVAGARTRIGKPAGAFAGRSAMDLGGIAIRAALERAGVAPDVVNVNGGAIALGWQGDALLVRALASQR
jgi:acetyl-CoA acetyltransferase